MKNHLLFLSLLCTGTLQAQTDTAQTLDEVVVTGQYQAQSLRKSVYNVRTVSAAMIRQRAATDIMSILNKEIGIRFSNDNTLGESDTKIMGIGGGSVKILLDGVPLSDRDVTKTSLLQVDVNRIERIEIVEGPMSVMYGTDALAGVINIITKKNTVPGLSVKARVQEESVNDRYSPFDKDGVHNAHLNLQYGSAHWKAGGYITRNNFGGWGGGEVYPVRLWKPKDQTLSGGNLSFRLNNFHITYFLDYLHENILSAGKVSTDNKSLYQYYVTNRFTHRLQSGWRVNDRISVNNVLSYQDYQRDTRSYTMDFVSNTKAANTTGSGYWDETPFRTFFWRGDVNWSVNKMVTVQPGVEIKHDQTSGERIAGKPRITDYAFFVSADIHPAERLHIRPGARVIHNSIYNAPPVIPSVNLLYDMGNNWQVRASYARGFRAPVLRELYFFFHDANHDINGNPDLKAEQSNSFNTAVSWHTRAGNALQLTTTLSGFYNQFRDRIDIAVIPGTTTYSYVNISSAKNAGGTLLNTIRYKQLEAAAGFSYIGYYNNLKGTSGGDQSTFAYAPEANANVLYTFSKLKGTVGLFYKFTGKVPSFQLGTTGEVVRASTAAFSMADLTVTKTINRLLFVQAGVRNVFDVTSLNTTAIAGNGAHSSGGPVSQAYGRSYFLGLHFEWNKTKQ